MIYKEQSTLERVKELAAIGVGALVCVAMVLSVWVVNLAMIKWAWKFLFA